MLNSNEKEETKIKAIKGSIAICLVRCEYFQKKEDNKMRKIAYSVLALFAFSIFFVAVGTLPSQAQGTMALYGQSVIAGWDTLPASGMIGVQLLTPNDEYLGVISDLVVDPNTGRILEAILSDVPGKGAEPEAVPFAAISHTGNGTFVLNLPDSFADSFPYYYWNETFQMLRPSYSRWAELRYYYSVRPTPVGSFKTSTLMGAPVETSQGKMVASVNDLVIDFRNDQVVYTVLSDVGGAGGRMVAVPFSELSRSGHVFTLHTTAEKLVNAPAFSWSETTNPMYAQNVYRYYGVEPYWEAR